MNFRNSFIRIASVIVFSLLLLSAFPMKASADDNTARSYLDDAEDYESVNKDYDTAIEYCNKSLDLDPNFADAYEERGYCYEKKENYDQAISDETRAIELNPFYSIASMAYAERAFCYYNQGNYSQAIADCDKSIELYPQNSNWTYEIRGMAYGGQGNYEQEAADETSAIAQYSSNWEAYVARARAYYQLGQYDNARSDVHMVQSLNKSVPQDLLDSLYENSGSGNGASGQE